VQAWDVSSGMAGVSGAVEIDERVQFRTAEDLPVAAPIFDLQRPDQRTSELLRRSAVPRHIRRRFAPSHIRHFLGSQVELEHLRGTAFHFAPVLLGAGSAVYFSLGHEPGFAFLAITLSIASSAFIAFSTRPVLRASLAVVLLFLAGMLFAKLETVRQETILLGDQVSTRVLGRILTIDKSGSGHRAVVEVIATERPVLKYQPERIKVTLRKIPQGLAAGDGIRALFLLRPPGGPVRPGSFDFAFDSYFDRIGATGVSISDIEAAEVPAASLDWRVRFWFEKKRLAIAERVRQEVPGQAGEMSAALIAGMTGGISSQTSENMRASGLAHVTSISGLHMALVAGAVLGSIRFVLAGFSGFASRHPTKKIAAVFALAAALAYYFLSGGGVATFRSFIMMAVMLAAVLFDRPALTMRNLVIAAIIILVLTPHEIMGPSFQMSFSATAALIAGYEVYSRWQVGRNATATADRHFIFRLARMAVMFVLGLAATSLVAGSATAIYSAYHFNRVAPAGLLANLAAMPPVSLIVMPMALVSILLMPLGLDGIPLYFMGVGVDIMLDIAAYFAALPLTGATGAMSVTSLVLMSLALIGFCILTSRLRILALPLAGFGLLFLGFGNAPDIVISEDGKLVAVRDADGNLYLNRSRPNRFTAQNWVRAYSAERVVAPDSLDPSGQGFKCKEGMCQLATIGGMSIARIEDKSLFSAACDEYDILVVAFPVRRRVCADSKAFVISARDLARLGSMEITLENASEGSAKSYAITRALSGIERPWHQHRAFSRAARGVDPYVPKPKPPAAVKVSG
jgi:ComEC/Rec2-related protein